MDAFVNRDEELNIIDEAVTTLLDKSRLLRTPIVEFYGVNGIGKTTLLTKVWERYRSNQKLSSLKVDLSQPASERFVVEAQNKLKGDKPVVVIIDSLEAAGQEQMKTIASGLSELVSNNNIFIVLGSRNMQRFDATRKVARKLTPYQLGALTLESCVEYLDKNASSLPSEARDLIYEWTKGYPLAMTTMTKAILDEKIDVTKQDSKKHLIGIIMKEVVDEKLLITVTSPEEKERLNDLLSLLSIPRRFNLVLMQDLIEHFASSYQLESSLAYITLPTEINNSTNLLGWRLDRAGFSIEEPVRNLFLLQNRLEKPQLYLDIHKFLAKKNAEFADEMAASGVEASDRTRYLREVFYHLASANEEETLRQELTTQIGRLVQRRSEENRKVYSIDDFSQFYEEFQLDSELQEALGKENLRFTLSLIFKKFIEIYRELQGENRRNWLLKFFTPTTARSKDDDLAAVIQDGLSQVFKQLSGNEAIKIYNELFDDKDFMESLGSKSKIVKDNLSKLLTNEG